MGPFTVTVPSIRTIREVRWPKPISLHYCSMQTHQYLPPPVPALPCPPLLLQVENAETTLPGTQHSVSPLENPKSSFIDWLAEKTSQSKTLKALMVQAVALILAKSGVKLQSLTLFVLILGYIYNLCNFSNFIYKMGIIIVHTS